MHANVNKRQMELVGSSFSAFLQLLFHTRLTYCKCVSLRFFFVYYSILLGILPKLLMLRNSYSLTFSFLENLYLYFKPVIECREQGRVLMYYSLIGTLAFTGSLTDVCTKLSLNSLFILPASIWLHIECRLKQPSRKSQIHLNK